MHPVKPVGSNAEPASVHGTFRGFGRLPCDSPFTTATLSHRDQGGGGSYSIFRAPNEAPDLSACTSFMGVAGHISASSAELTVTYMRRQCCKSSYESDPPCVQESHREFVTATRTQDSWDQKEAYMAPLSPETGFAVISRAFVSPSFRHPVAPCRKQK